MAFRHYWTLSLRSMTVGSDLSTSIWSGSLQPIRWRNSRGNHRHSSPNSSTFSLRPTFPPSKRSCARSSDFFEVLAITLSLTIGAKYCLGCSTTKQLPLDHLRREAETTLGVATTDNPNPATLQT